MYFSLVIKVIPLKLFYYQTFLKLGIVNIHDTLYEHYKNAIKKWGHRACLHISRLFYPHFKQWGYFYKLYVKSSNHLHTGLNLGYLKGPKFCLESKASLNLLT